MLRRLSANLPASYILTRPAMQYADAGTTRFMPSRLDGRRSGSGDIATDFGMRAEFYGAA